MIAEQLPLLSHDLPPLNLRDRVRTPCTPNAPLCALPRKRRGSWCGSTATPTTHR